MIDVVHTKQGRSFRGLVAYLIEGSKGQENPDRVAWTETRNLFTRKPAMAARVMAATALDQARLKGSAGISNAGRKSKNHVMHYTLSWAAEQKVSRREMMRAVNQSLAVLGEESGQKGGKGKKKGRVAVRDQFATEHQVLVVAHEDTENAHCHIVVNRVHPEHGVMLPTSNDFKQLSRWAERYERETGLIVDQRAINNAARDRGETVRSQKRLPRDVYEFEAAANDNRPAGLRVKAEQRAKDAVLAKTSARQRAEQKKAWADLSATHRIRKRELREGAGMQVRQARLAARNTFSEDWATLHYEHKVANIAFERSEERVAGKAINALKALLSLKAPVNVLWSKGAREAQLAKAQTAQRVELASKQREAEELAERQAKAEIQAAKGRLGHQFTRDRAQLILKHRTAAARLREKWKARDIERRQAWGNHERSVEALPPEKRFGAQMIDPDKRTKKALLTERLRKAREARKQARKDRGGDRGR